MLVIKALAVLAFMANQIVAAPGASYGVASTGGSDGGGSSSGSGSGSGISGSSGGDTPILGALNKIKAATTSLGEKVNAWGSDIFGVLPIATGSFSLLEDIKQGTKTAEASPPLSQTQSLTLANAVQSLGGEVNKTIDAIIAAKPKADALLVVSPVILFNLKQQQSATAEFSAKVIAKVPKELQEISQSLIQPINAAFSKVISAYQ